MPHFRSRWSAGSLKGNFLLGSVDALFESQRSDTVKNRVMSKIRLGEEFQAGNLCKPLEEFLEFPLPADVSKLTDLSISLPAATST